MGKLKDKIAEFGQWQRQPYEVAPMSTDEHTCATCGTEYQGNFCPRCGQSAKIGPRMSLWKTFLLFIDVWGLGNRGMFRTIRDLVLRPGYLITDYIHGHRAAYFPPFKLLFLLTTLSLLVGHGWNLGHLNYENAPTEISHEQIEAISEGLRSTEMLYESLNWVFRVWKEYPALMQLAFLLFAGVFFYGMFSKSKTGRWTFQEFFIGLVYMADMSALYTVALQFFGASPAVTRLVGLLYFIPLKQMSGYSWFKSLVLTICAIGLTFMALVVIMMLAFFFMSLAHNEL